jgi:putative transposase
MSRPLRIQFENAYYHVTCRGNGRQKIFHADYDREKFIEALQRSLEIYQVELIAFVFMTNHFHLIVKTPRANLQEFMRHLNISYTVHFNKRHHRSGHLFQGRYKSFLIDADSYLVEVSRYIHLNPVHTRQRVSVSREEKERYLNKYRWSSYGDYTSRDKRYSFLSLREGLDHFRSKASYKEFVLQGISLTQNPLEKGKGHGIVGDASFIRRILKEEKKLDRKREQPAARRALREVAPEKVLPVIATQFYTTPEEVLQRGYRGPARIVAMELLYRYGGLNQREIGERMGIDYSSVSVARKRFRELLNSDTRLQKQVKTIEGVLTQE